MEEEEISLRELIEALLKGKWVIVSITVVAVLLVGLYSFCIVAPTYESKAIIAVNKINSAGNQNKEMEGLEGLVDSIAAMPQINVQSYVSQAKTPVVIRKVMERLGVNFEEVSIAWFTNKINIANIKDTELLEITVKDSDPKKAAEIANVLSEELVEFVSATSNKRTIKSLSFLEEQVNNEQTKLGDYTEEMKQFLKEPESVAELESELETSLRLLSSYQERKGNLEVESKKVKATITALETQLVDVPDKLELDKNLFDDPALYELYVANEGKSISSAVGLKLKSEVTNPIYYGLKSQLEGNKVSIESINAERTSLESEILQLSNDIKDVQVKLADKSLNKEELQRKINIVKQNHNMFNKKYIESKLAETIKTGETALMVVSPAYQPTTPVAPRKMMNMAIAAVLGLMLGAFVVLFKAYWASSASER